MKILIVEDDPAINKGIKIGLENEGYAVESFHDGEKALKHILLNHKDYDILVLDRMLPGKSGDEICKSIREKKIYTPIIFLTALGSTHDKVDLLNSGADDYLTKPFSAEELLARIKALMRRPREALPNTIQAGPIKIDLNATKVYLKDKEILLTLKEFRILEYLVRHPNQVITRDQLLDNVWDFGFNSFSNVINVHITHLRKKLEKAGVKDFLKTMRGIGYEVRF